MHNGPQISRDGDWGDVTFKKDCHGKTLYCCRYCTIKKSRFETRDLYKINSHVAQCKEKLKTLLYGEDFVVCKICNFHCQKLGGHLQSSHKINTSTYLLKYGSHPVICNKSITKYSKAGTGRLSWVTVAKEKGEDITDKLKKIGNKISQTIMSNPSERQRRSNSMKETSAILNRDPEYLRAMSERAKITSARPDIIERRSAQLQRWRDNNPKEFKEKCTDKMLAAKPKKPKWFSKPEKMLYDLLKEVPNYNFKFNQLVKCGKFPWKSKRKQVDICDKKKKIFIEFDGPWHFIPIGGEEALKNCQFRDKTFEQYIIKNRYLLIRISYDQFHNSTTKSYFLNDCIERLKKLINSGSAGVYKIGKYYEQH